MHEFMLDFTLLHRAKGIVSETHFKFYLGFQRQHNRGVNEVENILLGFISSGVFSQIELYAELFRKF
jgi:hypothetical protein